MSVRRETRRDPASGAAREFWLVDVDVQHPDGRRQRIRRVSPVQTKRGAEQFERQLRQALLDGRFGRKEAARVPTLNEFQERFIEDYCKANHQKPSGIESKKSVLANYLIPLFGSRRLDGFTAADEDRLKRHLSRFNPATYNNAATVMNVMLRAAARWGVIEGSPHHFGLLKRQKGRPR